MYKLAFEQMSLIIISYNVSGNTYKPLDNYHLINETTKIWWQIYK